jgi:hypothetical protein
MFSTHGSTAARLLARILTQDVGPRYGSADVGHQYAITRPYTYIVSAAPAGLEGQQSSYSRQYCLQGKQQEEEGRRQGRR